MTDAVAHRMTPTGRLVPPDLDEAVVAAVVAEFYTRARADTLIGPIFARVVAADHWPQHIQTITDFWSAMLLGTRRYIGRPMPKHIAIPELGDAEFQRWLTLFRDTVDDLCPPAVAAMFVDRAERIAFNFRIRIAQFRGEDPTKLEPQRA